jgi:cell division protein ZipA
MDADTLRIILAVLGVLAVGGLYVWERRRAGDEKEGGQEEARVAGDEADDDEREPRLGAWEADSATGDAAPGERGQPDLVPEPPPAEPQPEPPAGPMMLTLHVVARGEPFEGGDIVKIAGHCGLEPGDLNIFHCLLGDEEHRETLFSMANMVKPGTFPFGAMAEFRSPGLTLFAELDGSVDDPGRMEELLGTAHTLAEELDGELRDAQRGAFTAEDEGRLRERVMRFVEARLAERHG